MSTTAANKDELRQWVLHALGGAATIVDVARHIWQHHEGDLRASGPLFYTWQYDMRWCATRLRHDGLLAPADGASRSTWRTP